MIVSKLVLRVLDELLHLSALRGPQWGSEAVPPAVMKWRLFIAAGSIAAEQAHPDKYCKRPGSLGHAKVPVQRRLPKVAVDDDHAATRILSE